jgi:hypothetical protein
MAILEAKKAEDRPEWVNLPDQSLVAAKLVGFEETEFQYRDKETNQEETAERYTWFFEVTEGGQFNGRRLRGQTSRLFTIHENCKAMNWAIALVGRNIEDGENINPEDLFGSPCRVVTEQSSEDSQGRVWDNVVDVLPAPSNTTASAVFG